MTDIGNLERHIDVSWEIGYRHTDDSSYCQDNAGDDNTCGRAIGIRLPKSIEMGGYDVGRTIEHPGDDAPYDDSHDGEGCLKDDGL